MISSEPVLTDDDATLVLSNIPHLGPITYDKIRKYYGDALHKVLNSTYKELTSIYGIGPELAKHLSNWRQYVDLEGLKSRMEAKGVLFMAREHKEYPALLKEIADAPIGIYVRGEFRPQLKTIAIVGTRKCTPYGKGLAYALGEALANEGFAVVSGMARGIDTAAHEGALAGGGATTAVLGTGIDVVYPPENGKLYDQIKEQGSIYSEFSLGRQADKRTFPLRNRIIAGMSQAIVVIETDESGGSMITARQAGEQGRTVLAYPGRVDQRSSKGCHQLIREGATLCRGVEDVLEEVQYLKQMELSIESEVKKEATWGALVGAEKEVYGIMKMGGLWNSEELVEKLDGQVNAGLMMATLMQLELKKLIAKGVDGRYEAL